MAITDQRIPVIREQTLEHIARHFGELTAGWRIETLLKDWGVPATLIDRSGSKWWTVNEVLKHYAYSTDKKDHEKLFRIIDEIVHPLMYNGDKQAAETAAEDFNKYLEYDDLVLSPDYYKIYKIYDKKTLSAEAEAEEGAFAQQEWEEAESELVFLRQSENKEKISTLRKAYQLFTNIVEGFCNNPSKPSHELNDAYIKTRELIVRVVNDLRLREFNANGSPVRHHMLRNYCLPFSNLFTAERDYASNLDSLGMKINWDDIRPEMHATYGDIDTLYREVEGSDVLSKPDVQQTLNDVSLLLSREKEESEKRAEAKERASAPQLPTHRVEITAIPEVVFRNAGGSTLTKSKERMPAMELSLPEPVRWEKVALKIKDGKQEVEVFYDNSHIITADYRQLRFFVGKKQQKPDRQWGFLCALSTLSTDDFRHATAENMRPMITPNKTLSINNVQQVKKLLVERLQEIFKTHDDPFHDRRDYYQPKFTILPEPSLRQEEPYPQGGRLNENRGYEEDNEEEAL